MKSTNNLSLPGKGHLFVSGPARSGTTLLELVLSSHPSITITPEASTVDILIKKKNYWNKKIKNEGIDVVFKLMRTDQKLNNWPDFKLNDFIKWIDKKENLSAKEFLDKLFFYFAFFRDRGTKYLGNKKGLYATKYGTRTKRLFPDAKFIFIVRDPRDVVRSQMLSFSWANFSSAVTTCTTRSFYIEKIKRKYPSDSLVIRYEDLVMTPEKVCQGMCDFLDLDFNPDMLKFYEYNKNGKGLISHKRNIHKHTTNPFNPDLIGQWEKTNFFTLTQLADIEIINKKYMKNYNYHFSTSRKNLSSKKIWIKAKIRILKHLVGAQLSSFLFY